MCELFAISSGHRLMCNGLLREFFSHGAEHPHGWGIASFRAGHVQVDREDVCALLSPHLDEILDTPIEEDILLAHIRKASVGPVELANVHPFVGRDASGRTWTLIHNGTLHRRGMLEPYQAAQVGSTDSEGVLLYLLDHLDQRIRATDRRLSMRERCAVVERCVRDLTAHNKVNLIIFDGTTMYVHANEADSLHMLAHEGGVVFSTRPLTAGRWEPVPLNTLLAYRAGRRAWTGHPHGNEYVAARDDVHAREAAPVH